VRNSTLDKILVVGAVIIVALIALSFAASVAFQIYSGVPLR
jgi:hypothetical protein